MMLSLNQEKRMTDNQTMSKNERNRLRKELNEVFSNKNSIYHKTNPLGFVILTCETLGVEIQEGDLPTDFHCDYESSKRVVLHSNIGYITVAVYRLQSGTYELTAYVS
jgi:hypothetical protein